MRSSTSTADRKEGIGHHLVCAAAAWERSRDIPGFQAIVCAAVFQSGSFLVLNPNAAPKDPIRTDPPIDTAFVVGDLEGLTLDGFDQVEVLAAVDLAQDDVAYKEVSDGDGCNSAELARLDFSNH